VHIYIVVMLTTFLTESTLVRSAARRSTVHPSCKLLVTREMRWTPEAVRRRAVSLQICTTGWAPYGVRTIFNNAVWTSKILLPIIALSFVSLHRLCLSVIYYLSSWLSYLRICIPTWYLCSFITYIYIIYSFFLTEIPWQTWAPIFVLTATLKCVLWRISL
jgi:hypothetical protein